MMSQEVALQVRLAFHACTVVCVHRVLRRRQQTTTGVNDMLKKKLGSLSALALALTFLLVRPSLVLASEPLNNTAPWFFVPGSGNPPTPQSGFNGDASTYTTSDASTSWGTPENVTVGDTDYNIIACGGLDTSATVAKVYITFTHAQGDIDIKLYTVGGVLLGTSQGVTDYEEVNIASQKRGAVVLKAYGFNGVGNTGGYKVGVYCVPR
jgi:hypothetical protein